MIQENYSDIVTEELLIGTLPNDSHPGFIQDYNLLSCLLRIYQPKTIFEIGTNCAVGTNVIGTALPASKIYSLDLDYNSMMLNPSEFPIDANGYDRTGTAAIVSYTQLREDSLKFDYSKYPCEAYFVDGAHTKRHTEHETMEILKLNPKIVIFHDFDVPEVAAGVANGVKKSPNGEEYELHVVNETRIAYLLKK